MKKAWDIIAVAGSRFARQGALVILMAIAARVLGKELVGVWALIYVVIQFGVLLADSGISTFVVREKDLTKRLYSTAFYLTALLAITISSVVALISFPLISMLGFADYWQEMTAGAAAIVPLGVGGVMQSKLRREKRFGILLFSDLLGSSLILVIATLMLINGFELWAFVASTFIGSITTCIVCVIATGLPAFEISRPDVKKIVDYSLGLLGFSSVNFWARNADSLLVGRFLGAAQLGVYSVAYRVMMLPLSQVNAIAHTVALPYLSPQQDDLPSLRASLRKIFLVIGSLTTIPMMLVWLEREFLVRLFLGPGWDRVGDLIVVLAPLGLLQSLVNPVGLCYQITGKTRTFFIVGLISTIASLLSFCLGVAMGSIDHVVAYYAVANLVVIPISVGYGMKAIGATLWDWLRWTLPFYLVVPLCWIGSHMLPMPTEEVMHWVASIAIVVLSSALVVALLLGEEFQAIVRIATRRNV